VCCVVVLCIVSDFSDLTQFKFIIIDYLVVVHYTGLDLI
jgi:hypothetical protein